MNPTELMENLLAVIPYWEYDVKKPLARYLKQLEGGLSVDDYSLLRVALSNDGLTMTEVAQYLTTTKQQASLKVDRLCERGYLQRVPITEDRRVVKVVVTEQAIRQIDAYREHMDGFPDVLLEKLPGTDLEALSAALKDLLAALPKRG